ncbi:DUF1778 domain-containing protein [Luteimonas sp. 8-5]|uniref:type II toxin-antitoxin system TacA family antitoxin n=1 Tax=Luteimonas sp. 8-5 TaxID=3039387 RepID=UPI00243647C5|nr:DUF1778 domain-containing protein [Luteimonas sp. 8-5]MDG6348268.1 DUF1778 domain-containing protein [Luteimonas sp. 8-5]
MGTVAKRSETAAETINFRVPRAKKALIDQAATALGKKRTEFMLDALSEKAREVLADQTRFQVDQRQLAEFNRLLEEPISDAAIRMLLRKAPWER